MVIVFECLNSHYGMEIVRRCVFSYFFLKSVNRYARVLQLDIDAAVYPNYRVVSTSCGAACSNSTRV